MSARSKAALRRAHAPLFAALGDKTRLSLVHKLSGESPQSISRLTEKTGFTRQAITKHLGVLESVGLVKRGKAGRECLYAFQSQPLHEATTYLDSVARQWDSALERLKAHLGEA